MSGNCVYRPGQILDAKLFDRDSYSTRFEVFEFKGELRLRSSLLPDAEPEKCHRVSDLIVYTSVNLAATPPVSSPATTTRGENQP